MTIIVFQYKVIIIKFLRIMINEIESRQKHEKEIIYI